MHRLYYIWRIIMKISDEILKTIEIIVDEKIKSLSFDRTVDGKIIKKTSTGYLVSVEGNQIDVSVLGNGEFNKNETVKVVIPQNNIKNAYIQNAVDYNEQIHNLKTRTNSLETYSNEEVLIGTWNGKKLYRRIINNNKIISVAATTWYTVATIPSNLDIVGIYGSWDDSIYILPLNYGNYHTRYVKETGLVQIYNASSEAKSFYEWNIIIEYIK